jgi:glycosyltransferase involved in cell wall biosynthesis
LRVGIQFRPRTWCAVPTALRLDANVRNPIPYYMLMLDRVRELADEFDVLHFHIDQFHFPLFRPIANKTVTTLHGRQDLPDLTALPGFQRHAAGVDLHAQRKPIPNANFVATVYHGLPLRLLKPTCRASGGYVAFLGRISPEKRPDRAIRIARALGFPMHISEKKSSRCSINLVWNLLGRSMSVPRASSSAVRERSYSRSTGRSDCR